MSKYYIPKKIDKSTDYEKGLVQKVDYKTDFGKESFYKGIDGQEYASIQDLEAANKRYWDSMKIDTSKKEIAIQASEAREELKRQIYANPNYALKEAGFDFLKTIHAIDSNLAKDIVCFLAQAVLTGDFEKAKIDYKNWLTIKTDLDKIESKTK